jgi:hypothetical protein
MVGGAGVCNQKAHTRLMGLRESLDGVSWRFVKEGHHMFRERDNCNASRIDRRACMICRGKDWLVVEAKSIISNNVWDHECGMDG